METIREVLIAVLTGGVIVAIIEGVREFLTWRRNRKAVLEDRQALNSDKRLEKVERQVEALVESQKY